MGLCSRGPENYKLQFGGDCEPAPPVFRNRLCLPHEHDDILRRPRCRCYRFGQPFLNLHGLLTSSSANAISDVSTWYEAKYINQYLQLLKWGRAYRLMDSGDGWPPMERRPFGRVGYLGPLDELIHFG